MPDVSVMVFSPFDADTDYFPKDSTFKLHFRVADLEAAVAELAASGIPASHRTQMDGVGHFARIHDPEGNPIAPWQAAGP
jgi:predicted enzyme related to lactoylglutathione lyase